MGANFFHCGPAGSGMIAKICNNNLLFIHMIGVAETLALGVKLGGDPKIITDVISKSSGKCWSIDTVNPIPGVLPGSPSSREY